jgi:hypothetical protein
MITKTKQAMNRFTLIACSALLATSSEVYALSPRPRVVNGTIEAIDWTTRTLRIKTHTEARSLTLVWSDRTRFIAGNRGASAAELTRHKPVTIWYLTPFFGERFASRILIRKDGSLPLPR